MTPRRFALLTFAALVAAMFFGAPAPAVAREVVGFGGYPRGTIVVKTSERRLYFVHRDGIAIRYPVGVGKAGMAWHGTAYVALKRTNPPWQAPPSINGGSYGPVIPGGSPNNPMGVAVLGLDRGNYAIHGTNNPSSIGGYVSHGCIRMYNSDVLDLYARAGIGTQVTVLR